MGFAYLEGCREYLNLWYQELKHKYHLVDENGESHRYENAVAKHAIFNDKGHLICYAPATLVYYAEVPCSTEFKGRLIYTREMCEAAITIDSCLNFYESLKNFRPRPVLECGIGSMCYSEFRTEFVSVVECPEEIENYAITPKNSMPNGKFVSPTLNEYHALVKNNSDVAYTVVGFNDESWGYMDAKRVTI